MYSCPGAGCAIIAGGGAIVGAGIGMDGCAIGAGAIVGCMDVVGDEIVCGDGGSAIGAKGSAITGAAGLPI